MGEGGGAGWDNLLQYFISLLNHVYTSRGTWNSSLMDENEVVVELGLVHAEVVGQHRDHHHCVRRWLAVRCRGRVELVRHVCGCALRVVAGPGAARTGCDRCSPITVSMMNSAPIIAVSFCSPIATRSCGPWPPRIEHRRKSFSCS